MTKPILTLDIIEQILDKNGEMKFDDIVNLLQDQRAYEIDNSLKASIFTDINIDKRFINLGENTWDLRSKHPYSKVHLPINELYEKQKQQEAITHTKLDDDMKTFVNNDE